MIPKKNRLPAKDFSVLMNKGRQYGSESFFLKIKKNNLGFTRAGVAVSKKLANNATQKNYYKRLARHVLKEAIISLEQPVDIALIVKDSARKKDFKDLKKEADELLQNTPIKKDE